jgi:hypothetical protein
MMFHNGVGRIDPSEGYISSNVASCCKLCNNAKSNMTTEEFLTWIRKVHTFQERSQ